jgi:PIN domain nuclease of toxin-antitoxin system
MATLVDPVSEVYVSAVAVWEATIKVGIGKLSLPLDELEAIIAQSGFSELPVTSARVREMRHLPAIHRDPSDRLLVAQARHEGLTLVTRDPTVRRYPIETLRARAAASADPTAGTPRDQQRRCPGPITVHPRFLLRLPEAAPRRREHPRFIDDLYVSELAPAVRLAAWRAGRASRRSPSLVRRLPRRRAMPFLQGAA